MSGAAMQGRKFIWSLTFSVAPPRQRILSICCFDLLPCDQAALHLAGLKLDH